MNAISVYSTFEEKIYINFVLFVMKVCLRAESKAHFD